MRISIKTILREYKKHFNINDYEDVDDMYYSIDEETPKWLEETLLKLKAKK